MKENMKELGTQDIGKLEKHLQKNVPNTSATKYSFALIYFLSSKGGKGFKVTL